MKGSLTLFGLGFSPEDDATLETLQALEDCDEVYVSPSALEFLRAFLPRARPARDARAALESAAAGRRVGLAVWGHPDYGGALSREAATTCRRLGVECRTAAANSPLGAALTATTTFFGGDEDGWTALRAVELEAALARPELLAGGGPVAVFSEGAAPERWVELERRLPKPRRERRLSAGAAALRLIEP